MQIVITGNIGSGKSKFTEMLASHLKSWPAHSADLIAREIVANLDESLLLKHFGTSDLRSIGKSILKDETLVGVLHGLIGKEVFSKLASFNGADVIVEVPLYGEAPTCCSPDLVVVVAGGDRAAQRDGDGGEKASAAKGLQALSFCQYGGDWVIDNSGSLADLDRQAQAVAEYVKRKKAPTMDAVITKLETEWYQRFSIRCPSIEWLGVNRFHHAPKHWDEINEFIKSQGADLPDFFMDAALLAAGWHDSVYRAGTSRHSMDEEDSAKALWNESKRMQWAGLKPKQGMISPVGLSCEMIIASKGHDLPKGWGSRGMAGDAAALFLDGDLSVLAASWERYSEYMFDIRKEWASIPDSVYNIERIKVLRKLQSKKLFKLSDDMNSRALDNLEKEIIILGG